MTTKRERYNLESVKNDIAMFFEDDGHWAYQYGSKAIACNKDSVFYKKQVQVIFEDLYPHDVTGKAVNDLISDGFLKEEHRTFGKMDDVPIIFVCRKSRRYIAKEIKEKIRIVEKYSDDELNGGCGKYAELLLSHMFENNRFKIIRRKAKTYKGKTWKRSKKDLDFIIERRAFIRSRSQKYI